MKRPILILLALAVAVALPACGVPGEGGPHVLPQPGANGPSPAPTAVESGPVVKKLYLVKAEKLVEVERRVPGVHSIEDLLRDLVNGPTPEEQDLGMTSALLGSNDILGVQLIDGVASVDLAGEGSDGRALDVFAFGQIVCTLGGQPGISKIGFTREGVPVKVPKGDGVLTQDPLTPNDYAELIAPR